MSIEPRANVTQPEAQWRIRRCKKLLHNLRYVSKRLIIDELLVEAAGVELFRVLITRNLLILGTATTAKKAPLPDPLYVYCAKMFFALESNTHGGPSIA